KDSVSRCRLSRTVGRRKNKIKIKTNAPNFLNSRGLWTCEMSQTANSTTSSGTNSGNSNPTAFCPEFHRFSDLSLFSIPSDQLLGQCRHVGEYEKLNRVGQGTYGIVYRARDSKSGEILALKRMRVEKLREGIGISSIREINLLRSLKHPNIVQFREVAVGKGLDNVFMVMEYAEQDLASLIDHRIHFTESQIKCLMQQLFRGLHYLHMNYIVHRDLKVQNLLLTDKGELKIADFGLARKYGNPSEPMSPFVVTLWYRAPELLFQSVYQSTAIDMWAAGCIFGELVLQRPILPGRSEMAQIDLIIDLIGTPNDKIWPGFSALSIPRSFNLKKQPFNNIAHVFAAASTASVRLLNLLLIYDPRKRATADECLGSSYFKESPLPCDPSVMPSFPQRRNL
ncbi:Cyclin-dependent kinase 10, partial [Tyrophagus putrescentiae]